jgi:hypothetical protein
MKPKKPSEEYLDFLRNNKEEIEKFNINKNYLIEKLHKYIDYDIEASFTPQQIEENFKGITLFNEINLNL